jgi:hypothetical protein
MTPERMAGLVARWARFYTRNLPAPIAERRIDEIDADVHDHIAHDAPPEPRIGASRSASRPGWLVAWPPTSHGVQTGRNQT